MEQAWRKCGELIEMIDIARRSSGEPTSLLHKLILIVEAVFSERLKIKKI